MKASPEFIKGIYAAIDRLKSLGQYNAAEKLRDSYAKLLGEL